MKYAQSTNGFYSEEIHGDAIPADAIDVTAEAYKNLMAGQAEGMRIVPDANGRPSLISPAAPTPDQIAAGVAAQRAAAYAKESDPLFFKAQRGEATMDEWLAKLAEIKARIPDGIMPS